MLKTQRSQTLNLHNKQKIYSLTISQPMSQTLN